jgi:ribosomal RNA assembly protein
VVKTSQLVKIPKERVGALIGPEGKTKKYIEDSLSINLKIDSESGDVNIGLAGDAEDPSLFFRANDVINAIGRGFSPEHAFRLIRNEDTVLDIIDLRTTFGRSESDIKRVKGRIIGMNGKTRRIIEELAETNLAVFGHTVSIIGEIDQAQVAREAIQMLVKGSMHSTVYRFLHRKRRDLKKKKLELWEKPAK